MKINPIITVFQSSYFLRNIVMEPGRLRSRKRKHDTTDESGIAVKSPYFFSGASKPVAKGKNITRAYKTSQACNKRLPASFFNKPCQDLAKALLGQRLVHMLSDGDERIAGVIVETEAYLGSEDSAAHSYKGHRSERVKAMYMGPGTCYVYLIYGMYDCLNISSQGEGQAVLIRALEPTEGIPTIRKFRDRRRKNPTKELKLKELCSGPGKLTEALKITKAEMNTVSLATSSEIWVEKGDKKIEATDIVACPRIGIDYATEEWIKKPLRFYIRCESCVSKRDKDAEKN